MSSSHLLQLTRQMLDVARRHEPTGMLEVVDDYRRLPEILSTVALALKTAHEKAQERYPVHPTTAATIAGLHRSQLATAASAADIAPAIERLNKADLDRLRAPRKGDGETMWDVRANQHQPATRTAAAPTTTKERVMTPVDDPLHLAGRIPLAPGEHLTASASLPGREDDAVLGVATTSSPQGPRVRLGIGILAEDAHRWRGADLGRTLVLDPAGAAALDQAATTMLAAGTDATTQVDALKARERRLASRQRTLEDRRYAGNGQRKLDLDEHIDADQGRLAALQRRQADRVARLTPDQQHDYTHWDRVAIQEPDRVAEARARQRDIVVHLPDPHRIGLDTLWARDQRELDTCSRRLEAHRGQRADLEQAVAALTDTDAADLQRVATELESVRDRLYALRDDETLTHGVIPAQWGDLEWETAWSDDDRPRHRLGLRPHDADPEDWYIGSNDAKIDLTPGRLRHLADIVRPLADTPPPQAG
jgi:hypothetical protein